MNHYKQDWYTSQSTSGFGLPPILREYGEIQDDLHKTSKLRKKKAGRSQNVDRVKRASQITIRAAGMGIALSAIDGPLPIMDTIGFGVFAAASVLAWTDVIVNWE